MKHGTVNTCFTYRQGAISSLLAFLFLISTIRLPAQTAPEFANKAKFLYNLTQFIEWPSSPFSSREAPFIISILGHDPVGSNLEEMVYGETVNRHPIVVQRHQNIKAIHTCHLLYISNKEAVKLPGILKALPNKYVLTVSDIPDFATNGAIICLNTKDNGIKLQVNLSLYKIAELNISSKLLQVAEILR